VVSIERHVRPGLWSDKVYQRGEVCVSSR
jgi:hypothetical protein